MYLNCTTSINQKLEGCVWSGFRCYSTIQLFFGVYWWLDEWIAQTSFSIAMFLRLSWRVPSCSQSRWDCLCRLFWFCPGVFSQWEVHRKALKWRTPKAWIQPCLTKIQKDLGRGGYKVLFDDLIRTLFEIYLYQPLSEYFQISELRDNI